MFKVILISFILFSISMANPQMMKNDPKRPTDKISHDLGITQEEFINCFNNVQPTPNAGRPESEDRVKKNKKVLLPCLQKANPNITNDFLDSVMDKYRPGGRKAQMPMR